MRWPFGPHHLTLKLLQKEENKINTHTQKKTKTKTKKQKKTRKNKKYQKMSFFSHQSNFFSLCWGVQIFPFWQIGPKSAHPQNTTKIGFQQTNFGKTDNRHETSIFGQKKQRIPVIIFFAFFFSLYNKNTKNAEAPIFCVFANIKMIIFKNST